MGDFNEFRKKLSEREITQLKEHEIQKIERVNDALERSESAEAKKEAEKKLRILFERAPQETLPFLVYCIYVGLTGLTGVVLAVVRFEGLTLYIVLGMITFILLIPLTLLPKIHLKKFFSWIFEVIKRKSRK